MEGISPYKYWVMGNAVSFSGGVREELRPKLIFVNFKVRESHLVHGDMTSKHDDPAAVAVAVNLKALPASDR